ncbi:HAD hydrolase family protein [Microbacterium gilvum]|uniref:Cof-type HAD-IIB family hydrolase n=1 Tax=Microbacterium gilvum TaxID=1336204 RepID=A0ABP9ABB2_9MICO
MTNTPAAIALDIDGTLIGSDKRIPAFTRSEIQRAVDEYGARVFFVTARGPQSTAVIEEHLGVAGSYATFGGSLVWARTSDGAFETLSETSLDDDIVRGILAAAADAPVHKGIYTHETWYVSALDYWGLREARNTAVWPEVAPIDATLVDAIGPVYKIMFRGEPADLAILADALAPFADRAYAHFAGRVLEIVSASAVKLPALETLSAHFGIAMADVLAFGDTSADVGMLEAAGRGVLMGNAVVDAAPHVERTLTNDEDGVGMIVRKYFPTGRPFRP